MHHAPRYDHDHRQAFECGKKLTQGVAFYTRLLYSFAIDAQVLLRSSINLTNFRSNESNHLSKIIPPSKRHQLSQAALKRALLSLVTLRAGLPSIHTARNSSLVNSALRCVCYGTSAYHSISTHIAS